MPEVRWLANWRRTGTARSTGARGTTDDPVDHRIEPCIGSARSLLAVRRGPGAFCFLLLSSFLVDGAVARPAGSVFHDCAACPEMVVIAAGEFVMGSPPQEVGRHSEEGPQRRVTIPEALAVGRYEVTFDDWDACLQGGGCSAYGPDDQGWGRGRRPVINVTWENAKAYVAWLSDETGQPYRLLSEAEWEYAARAGTTTPFWTGVTISSALANYHGNHTYGGGPAGEYRGQTTSVDHFGPNPWGIHDVHGNLWEWVEDCWHKNYEGAPSDGSAWADGDCSRRVLRGGSWYDQPKYLRAASRNVYFVDNWGKHVGFRVARALAPDERAAP